MVEITEELRDRIVRQLEQTETLYKQHKPIGFGDYAEALVIVEELLKENKDG